MLRKRLFALAFVSHAVIGNFCMMPMAQAADMPMPAESQNESMQTPMTPMSPMSSDPCEHCEKAQQHQSSEDEKSPCNGGSCFFQADSTVSAINYAFATGVAMPAATPVTLFNVSFDSFNRPISTAPPNPPISTQTIVLRF